MEKLKTVRIQVKDLPPEQWVELYARDIERIADGSNIDIFLHVREVRSHAGLRWGVRDALLTSA